MSNQNALQRTYYYQGELLAPSDFIRDQQYVRDVVSLQNQGLYTAGVVSGLAVTNGGSSTQISVNQGLAFSATGIPIYLAAPLAKDLSTANLAAGTYYVCILYGDNNSQTNSQQLQASKTIIEQPTLNVSMPTSQPATSAPGIILGQVTVAAGGVVQGQPSQATRQVAQGRLSLSAPSNTLAAEAPTTEALAVTPGATPAAHTDAAAQPGTSTPAAGAQSFTQLTVGPSLTGTGATGSATLAATADFSANGAPTAVAGFGFSNGASQGGVISLGMPNPGGGYALINLTFNGQRVWSVDQTGTAFSVSDAAVKDDITPFADALKIVRNLAGVTYLPAGGQVRRAGLVAQSVAAVLPEAVHTDDQGLHSVSYNAVIAVLVEAVKTLTDRVEALEAAAKAAKGKPKSAP
jgi:hypothetical protein